MKVLLARAAFIVLFTVPMAQGLLAQTPTATPTPEIKPPEVVQTTLHSTIMGEDRRVIIHLPRDYRQDASQKYPVMYVLDGTSQDDHTADKLTVLADAGLAPSAIVVGLPNTRGNRERDQTPPFMRRNVDDEKSPFGARR
jgi:predicted alpha/beta superfamily hydrolase